MTVVVCVGDCVKYRCGERRGDTYVSRVLEIQCGIVCLLPQILTTGEFFLVIATAWYMSVLGRRVVFE